MEGRGRARAGSSRSREDRRRAPLVWWLLGFALAGSWLILHATSALADQSEPVQITQLDGRQSLLFAQACAHCHLRPDIEVPVRGVDRDWKKRRARGFDELLANTINGVGNMPPLGTCGACTETDFRALVSFLALVPDPTVRGVDASPHDEDKESGR